MYGVRTQEKTGTGNVWPRQQVAILAWTSVSIESSPQAYRVVE
jgi:Mlc titration factor MtfA (ptsG expression regulator)